MEKQLTQEELLAFHPKTSYTIISKGNEVSIGFDEINHICKYGNNTVVYTTSNRYHTCVSLQEILNDLPVNQFFRVHRSHIVSLRFMDGVYKNKVNVGDYYLPLSKYYMEQLCEKLATLIDMHYHFYCKDE